MIIYHIILYLPLVLSGGCLIVTSKKIILTHRVVVSYREPLTTNNIQYEEACVIHQASMPQIADLKLSNKVCLCPKPRDTSFWSILNVSNHTALHSQPQLIVVDRPLVDTICHLREPYNKLLLTRFHQFDLTCFSRTKTYTLTT